MNTILRCVFSLLAIGATAFAADSQVRVAASKDLSVAIIDGAKESATRDAMHQAFAASLGAAMSKKCGGTIGVRVKCVGVDHAVFNLGTGVYDAVLVISRDVPEALRKIDAIKLSATPDSGKRERSLHFIVGNDNTYLQDLLTAAFVGAVKDQKFIDVFCGNVPAATGMKVASAGQ